MEWYKNGKLTEQAVRKMALPKGLPKKILPEHVAWLGILPLVDTPIPEHTITQRAVNIGVVVENNVAVQTWEIVGRFTKEEEAAFLSAKQEETEAKQRLDQIRADIEAEQSGLKGKSLEDAETWFKARLQESTLDAATKTALGKIFKKILSFLL